MVMSLRGRVPALRARSRERTRWSAEGTNRGAEAHGDGLDTTLPAPSGEASSWSRPKAKRSARKNSSRVRASAPADRPGRRERSKRA